MRSRPFRLLLQESSHLLGEDLLLGVGGNCERGKIRIQRIHRAGHWLRENRIILCRLGFQTCTLLDAFIEIWIPGRKKTPKIGRNVKGDGNVWALVY